MRQFKKIGIFFSALVACCFSSCSESPALKIVYEKDDDMINNYSLLAVNPDAPWEGVSKPTLNTVGADALINWILSEEGLQTVSNYGYKEFKEFLFYLKKDHPSSSEEIPSATETTKRIRMSTTTSVNDSGLLGYALPKFEEKYGYEIEVYSAGTGKAISNAKAGNADLLLVHSKSQEEIFINDGFARKVEGFKSERLTFMYNYFVLIGPKDDPAKCANAPSVKEAFKKISDGQFKFVSRGDNSGTHTKELSLWDESLGITAESSSFEKYPWYISANQGMGTCLTLAKEQKAYLLSDKATYLTCAKNNFVVE